MILSDLSEGSTQLMAFGGGQQTTWIYFVIPLKIEVNVHSSFLRKFLWSSQLWWWKAHQKAQHKKRRRRNMLCCNDKVVDSNLQCNRLFCYDCAYKTWMISTRMCPSCRLYLPNTFNETNCLSEKLKGVVKDVVFLKAQRPCANILILPSCIRSLRSVKWAFNGYATFLSVLWWMDEFIKGCIKLFELSNKFFTAAINGSHRRCPSTPSFISVDCGIRGTEYKSIYTRESRPRVC